jgi:hypothetical protein
VTVVVSSLIVIAWLVGDVARWWSRSKRGSDGKA